MPEGEEYRVTRLLLLLPPVVPAKETKSCYHPAMEKDGRLVTPPGALLSVGSRRKS